MYRSRLLTSTVLLCFSLLSHSVSAQDPTATATTEASPCEIDLGAAILGLNEANTQGTSGNQEAALKLIQTVREQLQAIETSCADLLPSIDLPQTYTAPNEMFTFQYPSEWSTSGFKIGQDWSNILAPLHLNTPIPAGGSLMLISTAQDDTTTVPPLGSAPAQGSFVFVSVGSPLHILESTGLYNQDMAQTFAAGGFTLHTLGEQFIPSLSPLGDITEFSLTNVPAVRPTLALDLRETTAHMYMLLVTINKDENLYAVLIGSAAAEELPDLAPLIGAIAETVKEP